VDEIAVVEREEDLYSSVEEEGFGQVELHGRRVTWR
jgi:hypothetical protein